MSFTPTGRFPGKGPNMQNIPIRTPEGAAIKEAFARALEKDPLGPGPHNPMFGMFSDEIVLEGTGGPCILGLSTEEAEKRIQQWMEKGQ